MHRSALTGVLGVLAAVLGAAVLADSAAARSETSPALAISSISPAVADRGQVVAITGQGLAAGGLAVTVGGEPVALEDRRSTRATFRVPLLAPAGEIEVLARKPGGRQARIALRVRFDGTVAITVDEGAAVSAPIGSEGVTIGVGGASLSIPPGAVPPGTTITATPLTALHGSPFAAAPVGVKLEPSGLVLLQPATLTLPRPGGPGEIVGFGFNGSGDGFHLVPHRVAGDTVQLKVWHFSGAGVLPARLDELATALSYEPTPAHELAEQRIAAALVDAQVNASNPGPAIFVALRNWRSSSVSHGLQIAGTTTRLDFFELAFGEWLAWLAYLQEYRDTLAPADSSFLDTAGALDRNTATDSAAAVARRQLEGCLGPDLPRTALRNVIRVASAVNLAALPIEETETSNGERPLPSGPNLPSACIDVQITAIEHAAAFARNRNNLFKVRAQVVFWGGDLSTTIPLRYRLAGIATETTSNGLFSLTRRPGELGADELELTVDLDTSGTDTVLRTIFEQRSLSIPVRERLELHARRATDAAFTDTIGAVTAGGTRHAPDPPRRRPDRRHSRHPQPRWRRPPPLEYDDEQPGRGDRHLHRPHQHRHERTRHRHRHRQRPHGRRRDRHHHSGADRRHCHAVLRLRQRRPDAAVQRHRYRHRRPPRLLGCRRRVDLLEWPLHGGTDAGPLHRDRRQPRRTDLERVHNRAGRRARTSAACTPEPGVSGRRRGPTAGMASRLSTDATSRARWARERSAAGGRRSPSRASQTRRSTSRA